MLPKPKLMFGNKLGTVQLLCWGWSYCVLHFFILFFIFVLEVVQFPVCFRTSTLVLAAWALILATPTFIFLYLPTYSTRATSKFNFQSLFRVVGCRVIRRAYICGSFMLRSPFYFSIIFVAFLVDADHISMPI